MSKKYSRSFSVVHENMRALDPNQQTKRWMSSRLQLCWKCQKDKPLKGGSIKMFGSVRRFICYDCLIARQSVTAKAEGDMK